MCVDVCVQMMARARADKDALARERDRKKAEELQVLVKLTLIVFNCYATDVSIYYGRFQLSLVLLRSCVSRHAQWYPFSGHQCVLWFAAARYTIGVEILQF